MKKILVILMLVSFTTVAHSAFIILPQLSVSRTMIDPGASTTVTAVFYTDQIEKHLAEVRVPMGWSVDVAQQDVFVDGEHGSLHNWIVTADPDLLPRRYAIELWIDGVHVDTVLIDVRQVTTLIYLPRVIKSTN